MNPDGRTRQRLGTAANRLSRWLAVLFPFSLAGSVLGQGYLFTAPGYPGAPAVPTMGNVSGSTSPANNQPGTQSTGQLGTQAYGDINNQPAAQPNSTVTPQLNGQPTVPSEPQTEGEPLGTAGPSVAAPVESMMQWGALHLHTRASYQFLYATGIHSQPGNDEDTITHTLSPGISLDLGPHVNLSYAPSIRFFSQKDFHNTVDHFASMTAGAHYGDWSFGLSQSISVTDEPIAQTSSQTGQKDYSAGLSAAYQVSDKLSLVTSGSVNLEYVDNATAVFLGNGSSGTPSSLSDSRSYSGGETLNYQFDEKLSGGFGATVGYTEQGGGFRSVNEKAHAHLGWHPGTKLSAAFTVGVDHQDFLSANASDAWNPIYSANISYHLFEPTTLSIYADHSVGASIFQNQITKTTAVGVGVQQRLLGKLQLSLGFGYTKSVYEDTTTANLARSRGDEGTSYSAGLTFPFLTRCSAATFYQYTQSTSSTSGFGYSSSQVGASVSWNY